MDIEFFREYGKGMLEQGMTLSYIAHYFGNNVYKWFNEEYVFTVKKEEK